MAIMDFISHESKLDSVTSSRWSVQYTFLEEKTGESICLARVYCEGYYSGYGVSSLLTLGLKYAQIKAFILASDEFLSLNFNN